MTSLEYDTDSKKYCNFTVNGTENPIQTFCITDVTKFDSEIKSL